MTRKPFVIVIIVVLFILVAAAVVLGIKNKGKPEEPIIAEEFYGLSAEIKEIEGKILLAEANILLADSTKEPIKKTIKIVVTDETKILKLKFPEEIPEDSLEPVFPETTEIEFEELKVGDRIDVETSDNISENVKNEIDIIAEIINILD
jgi:hypothetical protein